MSGKISRNKKQTKAAENTRTNKSAQILFAVFAILLILSMVLSAVANY